MNVFSSLTNRIFFATALLAVLSIAVAIGIVNRAVTRQANSELQRGLEEAATLVQRYRTFNFENFGREARFIADLPVLKAAIDTKDPATVEPVAREYQTQLANADLFAIADNSGKVLVRLGTSDVPDEALAAAATIGRTTATERDAFWPERDGILLIKSVPIWIDKRQPDVLGTLILGDSLDSRQAQEFKSQTNSEIAFGVNGAIRAATLPPETWPALASLLDRSGQSARIALGADVYLAFVSPLGPSGPAGQPMSIVLRSETERLRFLRPLHTQLAATAVVAVLAATLLSYGIARTVTRPVETITSTMREMASSGDLSRRIPVQPDARWQDEDARVLATTFNSMTDSIERFQREAAQRERLSSLGRLSTVVAHEIRNPLMIIKAALRRLRGDDIAAAEVRSAVADIDEEIVRLNHIVTEVLDFARPIKFTLAPANVNTICADAVKASGAEPGTAAVALQLDPMLPAITTDAERLRLVLVNLLANARHAVAARADAALAGDAIAVSTATAGPSRIAVEVRDRGTGISPGDLPRIFDPYFTTRRTGTGLGLPISKNIVDGLGGTIAITSRLGEGTVVRIELPVH